MRFLKLCFWIFTALVALVFLTRNWTMVTLSLWADRVVDINLPLLLVLTFAMGFGPPWLVARRRQSQLRRERAIAATRLPSPAVADDPGS